MKYKNYLLFLLLPLSGCASHEPNWLLFQKEHQRRDREKYEAPYTQIREKYAKEEVLPPSTELPKVVTETPNVIEPDTWVPGKVVILAGINVKGQPGYVLSPYAPDKGLVDVRGFPTGTNVRDPYSGRVMKVPAPLEDKPYVENLRQQVSEEPQTQNDNEDINVPKISPAPALKN